MAYFRAGEAVHYFPRGSYGSQQSLGCVELPYNQAKFIWPYLTYGTLVTVTPAVTRPPLPKRGRPARPRFARAGARRGG